MSGKQVVHIEAQITPTCAAKAGVVRDLVAAFVKAQVPLFRNGRLDVSDDAALSACVDFVAVTDIRPAYAEITFLFADVKIHAYRLLDSEPEKDYIEGEEEQLPACEQWELPNKHLAGLWDSLVLDDHIKHRLMGYVETSMSFSQAHVDSNIISWNRMALLYGPPGTGKTTICKALAQKMFVRFANTYEAGVLLEINSHSLFSKWFSESGKLVMKLFDHIHDIADDNATFVCVLIDEVESIAMARSVRSNEPGDAVRVVNSVLTSLDALRRRNNVLVLCTSNMIEGVDPAFHDRADVSLFLGPPVIEARFAILHSCLTELMRRGLIQPHRELSPDFAFAMQSYQQRVPPEDLAFIAPMEATYGGGGGGEDDADMGGNGINGSQRMSVLLHESIDSATASVMMQASFDGSRQQQQQYQNQQQQGQQWAHQDRVPPPTGGRANAYASLAERRSSLNGTGEVNTVFLEPEEWLFLVALKAEGLSGRALRKLPLKAQAFFLSGPSDVTSFLGAMYSCLEEDVGAGGAGAATGKINKFTL